MHKKVKKHKKIQSDFFKYLCIFLTTEFFLVIRIYTYILFFEIILKFRDELNARILFFENITIITTINNINIISFINIILNFAVVKKQSKKFSKVLTINLYFSLFFQYTQKSTWNRSYYVSHLSFIRRLISTCTLFWNHYMKV